MDLESNFSTNGKSDRNEVYHPHEERATQTHRLSRNARSKGK